MTIKLIKNPAALDVTCKELGSLLWKLFLNNHKKKDSQLSLQILYTGLKNIQFLTEISKIILLLQALDFFYSKMKWLWILLFSATTFSINSKGDETYSYPYYSPSSVGNYQSNPHSPSDYQIVSRQGLGGLTLRQDIRDLLVPSLPFVSA